MSDRYVTVVKRRHVRYREIVIGIATVMAVCVLILGFYLGERAALSGLRLEQQQAQSEQTKSDPLQARLAQLEGALQEARVQHDIDTQALEIARKDLLQRDERVAELESSLEFYQAAIAPEESKRGIHVKTPQWVNGADTGDYDYRIIVTQVTSRHRQVKGTLQVVLVGEQAGDAAELPLHMLSASHPEKRVPLDFKFFQVVEGQLVLPPGFTPGQVRVELKLTKPAKKQSTQVFAWQTQETLQNERQ